MFAVAHTPLAISTTASKKDTVCSQSTLSAKNIWYALLDKMIIHSLFG